MSGPQDGQGYQPPSYSHRQEQQFNSYDHPLQSNYGSSPSRYPQQQQQQLHSPHSNNDPFDPLQSFQQSQSPHHQQRFNDEDNLHIQQHRVARPGHDDRKRDQNPSSNKNTDYYSYPPPQQEQHQQLHKDSSSQKSSASTSLTGAGSGGAGAPKDRSLKARLRKLFKFPCSIYGKSLMYSIGIEALLVIIMQTAIVVLYFQSLRDDPLPPNSGKDEDSLPPYLDPRNQSRSIPAYMIVFVFAQLFQLVLAWDAVRAQNTIEIISIVVFNLCCFAYSIFEISQIASSLCINGNGQQSCTYDFIPREESENLLRSVKPFLWVIVAVIGLTQCGVVWLGYQLFQEFGWKIYKKIGADPNMKIMYRAYQIYLVLIKIDLFFFVGFSIQFIYLTLTKRGADPEYWLTIVVLPLTVAILYMAVYAVRHESRGWMTTFIVAMHGGVAYFIFKVVRMFVGDADQTGKYDGVKYFLTLFASLCLITILVTIINAAVCFRNFGKGLKPHIMKDNREVSNNTSATGGRFMEID
ncbi:hypothetical protein BG004_007227 [Podila humilis]|nr:hypothetical protein BG004_007227 [Podila humilis]